MLQCAAWRRQYIATPRLRGTASVTGVIYNAGRFCFVDGAIFRTGWQTFPRRKIRWGATDGEGRFYFVTPAQVVPSPPLAGCLTSN